MKLKDCHNCPSYSKDPDLTMSALGRPLNAPICLRYGHILGAPKQSPEETQSLRQTFAEECDSYMKDCPPNGIPVSISARVAEIDPDIISAGPTGLSASSCHACTNCVKPDVVKEKFGWILPLCAAKGSLIVKPVEEAKGCGWASQGMPRGHVDGITLRSRYQPGYQFGAERLFDMMMAGRHDDPAAYVTDSEVAPEDAADGIRAWRHVQSPHDPSIFVPLPIFDPSFFSEEERTMIPQTGDAHHPELYVDYSNLLWTFVTDAWEDDETLCLQSEPGLGKTQFGYYLAWLMQVPARRILISPASEADDLFGKLLAKDGSTYWHDGRFTRAWKAHAGILIVDEPNMGRGEVVTPLRSTTDNDKMLALDASDAESEARMTAPRGKYTFQLWCMNQSWDVRNVGANDLAMADMSRLTPVVVPYPPEPIERKIITDACKTFSNFDIDKKQLDDVMKVAKLIREASSQGSYPGSWGIREQIKVARKLRRHPFIEAYRLAALNFFEPETMNFVIDTFLKAVNSDGE